MRGISGGTTALFAACVIAGSAGASLAAAHDAGGVTPVATLHVDVRARIAARCGFAEAPRSPGKPGDVNHAERFEIPFKLDCNTPFVIGVKSQHGALDSDQTSDANGFALTKLYKVDLKVGTDGSPLDPDACWSDALASPHASGEACKFYGDKPGEGLSSDKAISPCKPSLLTVSWPGADDRGPRNVAGEYHDTITITVAART